MDFDAARLSTNSSISNRSYRSDHSFRSVNDSVPSSPLAIRLSEEKLYVAVDKDFKEGQSVLSWALQNPTGRRICIVHVHQPAQVDLMKGRYATNILEEQAEARANMQDVLNKYLLICSRAGVQAEKLHIEMDSIEKGIVKLISQVGIRRLVMGAASRKRYSRKMIDLKSEKAKYVRKEAPVTCHILFVCDGHLICTREGSSEVISAAATPEVQQRAPSDADTSVEGTSGGQDEIELHPYLALAANNYVNPVSPLNLLEKTAENQLYYQLEKALAEARNSQREAFEESVRHGKAEQDAFEAIIRARAAERVVYEEELKQRKELEAALQREKLELEQAIAETENLKREAYEESMRRGKAEEEAANATRRVKESEEAYTEELKQKQELEATLLKERLEREKIQNQRDKDRDELQHAQDQRSQLERRIAQSVGLFTKYKKERDELQIERDSALEIADDLRRKQTKSLSTNSSKLFSEFSFLEIEEATRSFHPSLKIEEGSYGTTYKGFLRHTEVSIKMLHSESMQGPPEYQHEVDILSKLRHPNLVTLIGACPDFWTLVFEYLPNGNLENRLNCKDNSPPLPWPSRVRIAAELCSALVFLHSSMPRSIVHGDVKPDNILLDANFVSKLSNFGACRAVLPEDMESTRPESSSSGEPSMDSDVYSFGCVLLRLLTNKPDAGISSDVQNALDKGDLKSILDYSAGEWPYAQAHQLAHLGLRCVGIRKQRPDLGSEVWRVLQAMLASCGVPSSSMFLDSEEDSRQAPHYFVCPISQEVMRDPHVAADGFTYEVEALRGWFDGGHNTSPMTNLQLENRNLVPNLALRSAIQEWLQRQT